MKSLFCYRAMVLYIDFKELTYYSRLTIASSSSDIYLKNSGNFRFKIILKVFISLLFLKSQTLDLLQWVNV